MREESATTFVDIHGTRHLTRDECALANMGLRLLDLIRAKNGVTDPSICRVHTAVLLAGWIASAPLETLTIIEQFITEKAGPATLPEFLRNKKETPNA